MQSEEQVGRTVEAIRETLAAKGLKPTALSLSSPIDGSLGLRMLFGASDASLKVAQFPGAAS